MSEDVIVSTMILYQMCLIMSRIFSDDEAEMRCEAQDEVNVVEAGKRPRLETREKKD